MVQQWHYLAALANSFLSIASYHANTYILIGGDFNARTGSTPQALYSNIDSVLCDSIPTYYSFHQSSKEVVINHPLTGVCHITSGLLTRSNQQCHRQLLIVLLQIAGPYEMVQQRTNLETHCFNANKLVKDVK